MFKTNKILVIAMWVIFLISVILMVSLIANVNSENEADIAMNDWIGTNLSWTYVLFIIAAAIILAFSVYQMVTEKKALKNGLLVVGFFIVIFGVAYLFTDDSIPQFLGAQRMIEEGSLTPKISQWISVGLNATYILFGLAICAFIYSSVSRFFK
jgi:uncharacterized membrane protein YecN with MAPEG domain